MENGPFNHEFSLHLGHYPRNHDCAWKGPAFSFVLPVLLLWGQSRCHKSMQPPCIGLSWLIIARYGQQTSARSAVFAE